MSGLRITRNTCPAMLFSVLCLWLAALPALDRFSIAEGVVINEILFAPAGGESEFVELLNTGPRTVNACELSMSDNRGVFQPVCEGFHALDPGAFVVLAQDGPAFALRFPGVEAIVPPSWPALNNSGDSVSLDRAGVLIDEVRFEASWGERGKSIERVDPAGPSSHAFNWAVSIAPSGATPGVRNSRYAPDRQPPRVLLAEVIPRFTVFVAWSEPVEPAHLTPENFRIQRTAPDSVRLLSPQTATLIFGAPVEGDRLITQQISDLAGNAGGVATTPLSYVPSAGDLVINEIMYEPLADPFDFHPDQPEYIEIHNPSGRTFSLRTLRLTGMPDERGDADTLASGVPYPVLVPFGFAVLYARRSLAIEERSVLTDAFPFPPLPEPSIIFLPMGRSSLSLSNNGDFVRLSTPGTGPIDELTYSPDWHHPALASTRGIALERRSPFAASDDGANWSSSAAPEGGSPGQPNTVRVAESDSAPSEVVISPVVFSPDGDGLDDALTVLIRLDQPPQSVRVRIFDSEGRHVHTLAQDVLGGATTTLVWDGRDNSGRLLSPGLYIFLIEALDLGEGRVRAFKKTAVLATGALR